MTNCANYKRWKLHHSPCHSDIRTPNQLNTPPGWLSCQFQTKRVNKREEEPIKQRGSPRNKHAQSIYFPMSFLIHFPVPTSFPWPFPGQFPIPIPRPFPSPIAIITIAAHCIKKAGLGRGLVKQSVSISAVGEHFSSRYLAQVDISISSHICSKIVLGRNLCNCSSAVDSVLDAHDQWLWIWEYVRDSPDAELVQEMRDLCECLPAYSDGIVFGIRRGLGSWWLISRSPVDRSSEGDEQSSCQFIVIQASSIVRIDITSNCTFFFSSETQSPVFHAVEVPKHVFPSYPMLISQVVIIPAQVSHCICNIGPSGGHRVHEGCNHRLVYGRIPGFFVGLPHVTLHCNRRGNWPGLIHSERRQDHPNVAVLMNVDCVMLLIPFDIHAKIEGDTPEIMHRKPILHLIDDLPNEALVSNDQAIVDVQNYRGNYVLIRIMEHEQSSVDMWCHEPNWDCEFMQSALPNMRRLLPAI